MSGRHPIHTGLSSGFEHVNLLIFLCSGMQGNKANRVLWADMPYGLPLDIKILPEYLNDLGYKSHLVGKWHLGHHSKKYTPTFRGFSSFTGCWTGKEDFYNHTNDNGDKEAREKLLVEVIIVQFFKRKPMTSLYCPHLFENVLIIRIFN